MSNDNPFFFFFFLLNFATLSQTPQTPQLGYPSPTPTKPEPNTYLANHPPPKAPWTTRRSNGLPQAIAHRGYKAQHPENTMGAFRGAAAAGAHALETDLHLARDGTVVLSHDADLRRCFGRPDRLADCDWPLLSALRTTRAPHEPMPRLLDLLRWLAAAGPALDHVWLLLDLKRDDDAEALLRGVAEALAAVPAAAPGTPWSRRVVLGCWSARYVRLAAQLLPGYPVAYIGWSVAYAREFLKVPGVAFNMFQKAMLLPSGKRLIRDAKKAGRPVYVWTVNEEKWMEWSIANEVDGVITDDPKLFLEVCDRHSQAAKDGGLVVRKRRGVVEAGKSYLEIVWLMMLLPFFTILFYRKVGWPSSVTKELKA